MKMMMRLFLLCVTPLFAQHMDMRGMGEPVSANGTWKWQEGDNLAWAAPDFDDSGWASITVPGSPLPRQSGPIWLRLRVSVPAGRDFAIGTAPLAEASELYWNGRKLGGLGTFSDHGSPGYDFFPRSVVVQATGPVDGQAVIALRLNRPKSHAFYPIQLGESAVFIGSPASVQARIDSLFTFPKQPWYVFAGAFEWPNWFSVLMGSTYLLLGLYFVLSWYTTPEIRSFVWLGLNILALSAASMLFGYYVETPISLAMGARLFSILMTVMLAAFLELQFDLAAISARWPRLLLYIPGLLALVWELLYPDRTLPCETFLYIVAVASPILSIVIMKRNYSRPSVRLLAVAVLPMVLLGTIQIANGIRHMTGDAIDHPLLAWERSYDALLNMIATLMLVGALGLYLQKSVDAVRREKARMGSEFEAARNVQQFLLQSSSRHAEYAVDAVYLPATEVGGDFYQCLDDGAGGFTIVAGDVSGKGLKAAMLVSMILGALRRDAGQSPSALLSSLNAVLSQGMDGGFATCLCANISHDGRVRLANAGHLAPYADGKEVPAESGLPLGVVHGIEYDETTFLLLPGEQLTIVSDGVVEAANGKGELFGFDRTQEISGKSAGEIAEIAKAWGQNDDITVVTLCFQAANGSQTLRRSNTNPSTGPSPDRESTPASDSGSRSGL